MASSTLFWNRCVGNKVLKERPRTTISVQRIEGDEDSIEMGSRLFQVVADGNGGASVFVIGVLFKGDVGIIMIIGKKD